MAEIGEVARDFFLNCRDNEVPISVGERHEGVVRVVQSTPINEAEQPPTHWFMRLASEDGSINQVILYVLCLRVS